MGHGGNKKALAKKNTTDNALLAAAVASASNMTAPPSDADKAVALSAAAATTPTTAPVEEKAVNTASTNPPAPPPASDNCPVGGVKSLKAKYLSAASAKAIAEVNASAASNEQSATESGSEDSQVNIFSLRNWFPILFVCGYIIAYMAVYVNGYILCCFFSFHLLC